jgi:hypothetical protein
MPSDSSERRSAGMARVTRICRCRGGPALLGHLLVGEHLAVAQLDRAACLRGQHVERAPEPLHQRGAVHLVLGSGVAVAHLGQRRVKHLPAASSAVDLEGVEAAVPGDGHQPGGDGLALQDPVERLVGLHEAGLVHVLGERPVGDEPGTDREELRAVCIHQ